MSLHTQLRTWLLGAPLNPSGKEARRSIALAGVFAWAALGANAISSSSYGPEESFRALGEHTELGLYLVLATAATVFIIALAYNQVIELFPTGGGGYRVATRLIGPYAGMASGAALVLDYVLVITISVVAGADAVFSLLPPAYQEHKLATETGLIVLLIALNLRGMNRLFKLLLPIFLGFIVTHALLIIYGLSAQASQLPQLLPAALADTGSLSGRLGWAHVAALLLLAYSQGGATYAGLEAVSNNVNVLAEPRVRNGKITMLYVALSLALIAGGILLLYLLWGAEPDADRTLNAVAFGAIIQSLGWDPWAAKAALWTVMALEAGLLLVAANTGFLGGPAVLSDMAADSWVPHKFRYMSTRMVTENGILVMGLGALGMLAWTRGSISLLIVLYSISVFLSFAISLFGLCVYWWRDRGAWRTRLARLALSAAGFLVCAAILAMLFREKFAEGGWLAALIIAALIGICLIIRHHYNWARGQVRKVDEIFADQPFGSVTDAPKPDASLPTAVFLVGSSRGGGLHALLWVQRMFPGHFRNFIFISARTVDSRSYGGSEDEKIMQMQANVALTYFVNFCNSKGWAAKSYLAFGTDPTNEAVKLAQQVHQEYPNCIFFASKLVFEHENWLIRLLHNEAALAIQRRLHLHGLQMVILPMKI
jgi:amino acid transporter